MTPTFTGTTPAVSGSRAAFAVSLRAEGIVSERGGRPVLGGVSFRLESGEGFQLTAPNGAGKSTLLRILAGLLAPTAGRVIVDGLGEDDERGAAIHYVGHQDAVKTQLTVRENLAFWAAWQDAPEARVAAAMAGFGLTALAELPAAVLSAGQRRRLGLARLLLGARPIWLLDEPTVALDSASRGRLREVVAGHLEAGGIAIAATHDDLGVGSMPERPLADLVAPTPPERPGRQS